MWATRPCDDNITTLTININLELPTGSTTGVRDASASRAPRMFFLLIYIHYHQPLPPPLFNDDGYPTLKRGIYFILTTRTTPSTPPPFHLDNKCLAPDIFISMMYPHSGRYYIILATATMAAPLIVHSFYLHVFTWGIYIILLGSSTPWKMSKDVV